MTELNASDFETGSNGIILRNAPDDASSDLVKTAMDDSGLLVSDGFIVNTHGPSHSPDNVSVVMLTAPGVSADKVIERFIEEVAKIAS